jgi:hypothetical protein
MAIAMHSMSGGHGSHLSPAARLAAAQAISKLSHDTISPGSGSDTVQIAGSATLQGAWSSGSSSAAGGHAFSFDTLQAGGAQLLGNFAGQQTAAGGYTIASRGSESSGGGGSSSISLDNGKTLINIKNLHH